MAASARTTVLLALVTACSFPPPPDVGDPPSNPSIPDDAQRDAPTTPSDVAPIDSAPDAPDVPGTVLQDTGDPRSRD